MRRGSSIPSPAEADRRGSAEAYSHKGLTYPFGRRFPDAGELIAVADGIGWARFAVPGALKHVNVLILDDDHGVAVVDTGLDIAPCREAWEALIAGPLAGRRVTRIIVTHFHPDHVGLAGWLAARFEAPLAMTRAEWLWARLLTTDIRETPPPEAPASWRLAGWDEDRIVAEATKGWGRFASVVTPVPMQYLRLVDGQTMRIGTRTWRVVTGCGHSPDHACLLDPGSGSGQARAAY